MTFQQLNSKYLYAEKKVQKQSTSMSPTQFINKSYMYIDQGHKASQQIYVICFSKKKKKIMSSMDFKDQG